MTGPAKPERYVRCPRCGGQSLFGPANAWRPFCSERCKLIDLGQWATGSYRIPVEEDDRGVDHEDPAT